MINSVSWKAVSVLAVAAALTMVSQLGAAVGVKGLPIHPMAQRATSAPSQVATPGAASRDSLYALMDEPGENAYEKLKNLYKNGGPITLAEVNGWFGGRIAMQDTPTVFNGALLIAENVTTDDGGPVSDSRFLMMGFTHPAPNFFDALSPAVVTEARTLFKSLADHLGDPKQTANGVEYTYHNSLGLHRYYIKKNGQYLVQKVVYPTNKIHYAYYFKKLELPGESK
jgi:hypothetical protein